MSQKFSTGAKVGVAAALALGLTGAGLGISAAVATDQVTVIVDGQSTTTKTRANDVAAVLDQQGITLGQHDEVAPALNTKIVEGSEISVRYGRPVTLTVDGKTTTRWTTATTLSDALTQFGLDDPGAQVSTSRSAALGRDGLKVDITTPKQVGITLAGGKRAVEVTGTVAEALKEAGITVGPRDLVTTPDGKTKIALTAQVTEGMQVKYAKVGERPIVVTKPIAFDKVTKNDPTMDKGETKIITKGVNGAHEQKRIQVYVDGKLVADHPTGPDVVVKAPVDQVTAVGTKEAPAPAAPAPTTSSNTNRSTTSSNTNRSTTSSPAPAAPAPAAPAVPSGSVWDRLAMCESGGNWAINTGNGFYGGLQFTLQTWRGFGGTGMPQDASREQQIAIAEKVLAVQGWGAWPACTRKLGLR